ncbi:hypothetical protein WA588_003790 [Blastocystis sp. NMH]
MWLFLSVVCCLIVYIPSSKYIKAWLNKRRRLLKMKENLTSLLKRKDDLISLSSWATERGDRKEANMIQDNLATIDRDIEATRLEIASVQQMSVLHPGYESL